MNKNLRPLTPIICLCLLFLLCTIGCTNPPPPPPPPAEEPNVAETPTAPIPADVTYTILEEDTLPGTKRSLSIRLNRKVSEEVLHSIAIALKNSDSQSYARTFILYYLPSMDEGRGAWASTHFNPELEVRILGLTAEQETELRQDTADVSREVIGSWLDERPFVAGTLTLYRQDGELFLERKFKDGSEFTKDMVETSSSGGRRFEEKGGSNFGDHYILGRDGDLQIRDQDGLIAAAKRIP